MKDALGDRMKMYENQNKKQLLRRTPVIVRVDGKCFSTFCRRFKRPYDQTFNGCMNNVMKKICKDVQGAKIAERHSDEISILIADYDTIKTSAYFDYSVQKIVSVIPSMATAEFCKLISLAELERQRLFFRSVDSSEDLDERTKFQQENDKPYLTHSESWPSFDCRCFNIPEDDVANYFLWRYNDALRNSINMLAQSNFSHKELQGKTNSDMQEMLFTLKGINWNNIDQGQKAGYLCTKKVYQSQVGEKKCLRSTWEINPSPSKSEQFYSTFVDILKNIKTD